MELLEACHDSPLFLRNLMACFQEVILVTDGEGNIFMANEAVEAILGYAPRELNNKNLSLIFTPEDLTYFYPNLLELTRKSESFQGEILLVKKSKVRFFAFITLRPFNDPTLGKSFMFVSIRDIHDQKQLEKASNENNYEDLVKVANGVAHELRNPLMGIGGFVKRMYDRCNTVHENTGYYNRIVTNLKKIEVIVGKVEYLARLPKPSFEMEPVQAVIEEGMSPYYPHLEERKIKLVLQLDGTVLKLDRTLIVRVFAILMENALDVLPDGGTVMVLGATSDNRCEIEFSDTGPGISTEDLPFIFNPFFSTKADGAGIDLSIVKRIVESHGGGVEARSEHGRGATFLLRFPLERRRALRISPIQK
jgi:PAS domain S-box-containing protein